MLCEGLNRRMVKQQRRRQLHFKGLAQLLHQLCCCQRVQSQVHEWLMDIKLAHIILEQLPHRPFHCGLHGFARQDWRRRTRLRSRSLRGSRPRRAAALRRCFDLHIDEQIIEDGWQLSRHQQRARQHGLNRVG